MVSPIECSPSGKTRSGTRKANDWLLAVMLFLIVSPGFSLVRFVTGEFFPNEKLAGLLALVLVTTGGYWKKLPRAATVCWSAFCALTSVMLMKVLGFHVPVSIADINLLYWLLIIPFYLSVFRHNAKVYFRFIEVYFWLNVCVAALQWLAVAAGYPDVAMALNNYPPQDGYTYPVLGPIVRVAGTFNESSQLALFSLLVFTVSNSNSVRYKFSRATAWMSLLITMSTTSATAIVGIIVVVLLGAVTKDFERKNLNRVALAIVVLVALFPGQAALAMTRLVRMTLEVDPNQLESERMVSMLSKLSDLATSERVLLGFQQTWSRSSFDFLSIYLYGYGLIGFLAVASALVSLLRSAPKVLLGVVFVALLGNGNLLVSIHLIILGAIHSARQLSFSERLASFSTEEAK